MSFANDPSDDNPLSFKRILGGLLAGSSGKVDFDSEPRQKGEETAELIVETPGTYWLDVVAKYKGLRPADMRFDSPKCGRAIRS